MLRQIALRARGVLRLVARGADQRHRAGREQSLRQGHGAQGFLGLRASRVSAAAPLPCFHRSPEPRARDTSRPAAHPTAAPPGRRCAWAAGTPPPGRRACGTPRARRAASGTRRRVPGRSTTSMRAISSRVPGSFMRAGSKAARRTLPCVSAVATTYLSEKRASAGVRRRFVARNFLGGAVAADADALDLARRDLHAALQRQRAVDGGEGMAAAGVVLEGHAANVECLAQRRKTLIPIRPVRHRAAEARVALDHVQRPGDAFLRRERGGDARLGGAARVQRLGHRIHAEGLLQGRRRTSSPSPAHARSAWRPAAAARWPRRRRRTRRWCRCCASTCNAPCPSPRRCASRSRSRRSPRAGTARREAPFACASASAAAMVGAPGW